MPHRSLRGHPALATATHGPTGIVPFGRAGDESSPRIGSIGTVDYHSNFVPFDNVPSHFNAVPHHPRSCSASAGRDSLRSVGHAANAATLLNWNDTLRFEDTCFDERCSMFAASCSRRIRLASMPSRPSSARRPCLAISVQSSLTCATVPSDSNREHFQPNSFASTANPLQEGDASY